MLKKRMFCTYYFILKRHLNKLYIDFNLFYNFLLIIYSFITIFSILLGT